MSRLGLLSFALLGASGCGGAGSLCEKWADEFGCDDDDFDVEECEEEIAACDADDRQALDDFYQCVDDAGLFVCEEDANPTTTGLTDALENLGAVFACLEALDELSEECQGEVMTGSTGAVF